FQEYFEKLRREPERWGKPFSALLGALDAQIGLETAAIGGKDSMSGSFLEYDVPPTLVSFAVAPADARKIISPEFKAAGHDVALFCASENPTLRKALQRTKDVWREIHGLIADGTIVSAWAIDAGGTLGGVRNMCLGNDVGFRLAEPCDRDAVYAARPGSILAELTRDVPGTIVIGETLARPEIVLGGETVPLAELLRETEAPLEPIFPTRADAPGRAEAISFDGRPAYAAVQKFAAPRAAVFSFPGTNSELDTARAVERAGGHAELFVVKNLTPALLAQSVAAAVRVIQNSQMLILPGGFAGGDEPDGSAKFITAFFRSPAITDAVHELLYGRYGLMLGICNGFQALIKLGLVPFGRVVPPKADSPTLTYNVIGRHQARYVYTRVSSAASPWMCLSNVGDVHALPVSHGEGRFAAGGETLAALIQAGQVATQYVDEYGAPSMDIAVNPNGSLAAIEGIFSPDGRVLGKMGHTERRGAHVAKNIHGDKHQPIFESGVHYFK
ncbi:MAG: phosphoribosylformylglycinamidine synthase subunit PurQ, partial [Oscillospiraceae bacterium]|nr:phosphoribosylformylglycinamidine synthase subunit PurQ [Oscillospiraceae bacterium]